MPYSKEFDEEKYESVKPVLALLEDLEEEKTLLVESSSPEEADKKRWLLYDYFHFVGNRLYKIKRFHSYLFIGKVKPTLSNVVSKEEIRTLEGEFDSFLKELIVSPDARLVASKLVQNKSLSFAILSVIFAEYSRVME